jgi:TPP-dependent pyruvate/acetoin dehydrogenase alpha subunit
MSESATTARLYQSMLLIREVENYIAEVYNSDLIKSPVHLSIGQESVAVGVCDALEADDFITHTYRCHASYIAKGGDLPEMMAELYGKRGGCAGGKAGSMHLIDTRHGVLGASAVVGTTIPIAAGYAFALQRAAEKTGKQQAVVAFFGDGATEEGCFMETLNMAALKQLPILFVCENNRLAIHTPLEKRWSTEHLCERVQSYNIPTHQITDGDVFKLRDATLDALAHIRAGKGPVFMECFTYRWKEHVGPNDDHHESYRDQKIFDEWKARDQIPRLAAMLDEATRNKVNADVKAALQKAIHYAEGSEFSNTLKDLYSHVYA